MKGSREDQSILGVWWFTIDRALLTAILLLMIFGVLMSLAASPLVAAKLGYDPYYFVKRHVLFIIPGFLVYYPSTACTHHHHGRITEDHI